MTENTGYLQWTSTNRKSVLLLILDLEFLILEDDLICYLFTFDRSSICMFCFCLLETEELGWEYFQSTEQGYIVIQ